MLDWQRSKVIELELYIGISSVGIGTLAASAMKYLTCHSLPVMLKEFYALVLRKGRFAC